MVKALTITAATLRILQVLISIVLLGISGRSVVNKSTLSSLSNDLSDLISYTNLSNDTSIGNLQISSIIRPQGLSIATASVTFLAHSALFKWVDSKIKSASSSSAATTSSTSTDYFSLGLSASELSSLSLWFSSAIYQIAKYGSWNCGKVDSLSTQYNITSDTTGVDLSQLLGTGVDFNLTQFSNTTDEDYNTFLDSLQNLTSFDPDSLSFTSWNDTSEDTKQQLFIELSQDCQLKKAGIAVSVLGFVTFLFSGSTLIYSLNSIITQKTDLGSLYATDGEKVYIAYPQSFKLEDKRDEDTQEDTASDTEGTTLVSKSNDENQLSIVSSFKGLSGTPSANRHFTLTSSIEYLNTENGLVKRIEDKPTYQLQYSRALLFPTKVRTN